MFTEPWGESSEYLNVADNGDTKEEDASSTYWQVDHCDCHPLTKSSDNTLKDFATSLAITPRFGATIRFQVICCQEHPFLGFGMVIPPACQKGCVGRKVGWRAPGPWPFRRYGGQEPVFGRTLRITLACADATSSWRWVAFTTTMNAVSTIMRTRDSSQSGGRSSFLCADALVDLTCSLPSNFYSSLPLQVSSTGLKNDATRQPPPKPHPTQSTPVEPSSYHFVQTSWHMHDLTTFPTAAVTNKSLFCDCS